LLVNRQFCAWSVPLHDQITTWARLAELLNLSSAHVPAKPLTGCTEPVIGVGDGPGDGLEPADGV
jgi:hypothetical protein